MKERQNTELIKMGYQMYANDEMVQFFAKIRRPVEELERNALQYIAAGDEVVVLGNEKVRGQSSGRIATFNWAHAWTVRDGQIVNLREYYDTAATLAAFQKL